MIREETQITEASCDACGRDLVDRESVPGHSIAHYGRLTARFGFGSRFDTVPPGPKKEICDVCWEKALLAIGLSPAGFIH